MEKHHPTWIARDLRVGISRVRRVRGGIAPMERDRPAQERGEEQSQDHHLGELEDQVAPGQFHADLETGTLQAR